MSVQERLSQLEARCRRLVGLLWIGLAATGVLVFAAAEAFEEENTIRAEQIEVVDPEGRVRVRLGKADAGYGVIVYDDQGQFRSTLTYAPGGAVVQLRGAQGDVRLMAVEDGAGVTVGYAGTRAGIIASEEHARLEVRDKEGGVVFAAPKSQPTTVKREE